jgi:hypothetical protein
VRLKVEQATWREVEAELEELQLCPSGMNREVWNHLPCSLGLQQVSGESCPS